MDGIVRRRKGFGRRPTRTVGRVGYTRRLVRNPAGRLANQSGRLANPAVAVGAQPAVERIQLAGAASVTEERVGS
jgi:hypothetical protein